MMIRHALVSTAAATALLLGASPAFANTYATITVTNAPPPLRAEVVPAPRSGMEWVPGHWEWRRNHHVWVGGYWIKSRPGYVYAAPAWVERSGRWHYTHGRWDRDRDGIPNRYDRDRDGDGVPNRYDHHPNNRHRY